MKKNIIKLREIKNPKGNILKILNKRERSFKNFGEAYLSKIKKGSIKAWKNHKKNHLNLIVVSGRVKFVIYYKEKKNFKKIVLSEKGKKKLWIQPGLWFGFMGLGKNNIILSISSGISKETEILRKELKEIKFNW